MKGYMYQAILSPEEDGSYSVEVPDLPGCYTCGDDFEDALRMAADAMRTFVASAVRHREAVPQATETVCPEGCKSAFVYFETDASYIVEGEVVSAAQAARELGVSAGRVTHMLDAGVLDGYRQGRRTYITAASIQARKADTPKAGRPKAKAVAG